MKSVLQEIHDRSLWQVLGIYLGGSWIVLQVVDTLNSTIGMPAWVVKAAFVLLLIGLPIIMMTAFVQRGWRGHVDTDVEVTAVRRRRHFWSWRNAMVGGAGAFMLLGIGTAAWLVMRTAGIGPAGTLVAKGILEDRGRILLADFENSTDDPTIGDVVTEALRVDLAQSEAVDLVDRRFVTAALERMERPEETPVTEDVALEMAEREGIKAIVTGDVARAGGAYVLSAVLVASESGEALVSHRESAKDSTRLLEAIDKLSRHIRERVGDPLGAIAGSPPLAQVTTSNLEALRAYSEARRLPQADVQRRVALLEEAVALDSTFAMAWYGLGIALGNYGVEPGRVMEARTRAFEMKDRLTENEQNAVANQYYMGVTNEPRQAIPYLEAAIEANPGNNRPVNNLAEAYRNLGELETALELYHQAVAMDSTDAAIPYMNIGQVSTTVGDWEMVETVAALLDEYAPPFGDWHRSIGSTARREFGPAEEAAIAIREAVTGSAFLLARTTEWLAAIVMTRGRLSEAEGLWREGAALEAENGSNVEALRNLALGVTGLALARGEGGPEALDAALEMYPLSEMDPVARPYLDIATAYATVGDPASARALVDEFERTAPDNHQRGLRYQYHQTLGLIALGEGRFDEAVAELRQSASRPQEVLPLAHIALAFDAAGQTDSARVAYRRYLEQPHWLGLFTQAWYLASSLERLAQLEDEAGDSQAAVLLYAEFVELWEDADPELQPRVQAAQRRLEEILAERG